MLRADRQQILLQTKDKLLQGATRIFIPCLSDADDLTCLAKVHLAERQLAVFAQGASKEKVRAVEFS